MNLAILFSIACPDYIIIKLNININCHMKNDLVIVLQLIYKLDEHREGKYNNYVNLDIRRH